MLCEVRYSYRETTIERILCDNILLEILSYLNIKDLKNASLVCKRWNEIIGSSTRTMKKFIFQITNEMLEIPLEHFGSNRNHQNYVIQADDSINWAQVAANIQLDCVKSFRVRRSRFCAIISYEVVEFLSRLKKLESLTLEGIRLTGTDEFGRIFEMSKLNWVLIDGDDFTILERMEMKELQYLRCIGKSNISQKDLESIAHSIVKHSQLKSLKLWNCVEMFEYIEVNKAEFHRLESIEVYHINVNPVDVNVFSNNLRNFLVQQADSLRDLRFDFSMLDVEEGQKLVNDFLRIAYNKCTNLTTLDIRNLSISRQGDFYANLSINYSIKSLKVHWNFDGEVIEGLLLHTPNLKELEAEFCYLNADGINKIATLCRQLIHLEIFKLIESCNADTIFENLKYLTISRIEDNFDPLISLVTKSPMIQQIEIHECANSKEFPMKIIANLPCISKLIMEDQIYDIYTDEDEVRMVRKSS